MVFYGLCDALYLLDTHQQDDDYDEDGLFSSSSTHIELSPPPEHSNSSNTEDSYASVVFPILTNGG